MELPALLSYGHRNLVSKWTSHKLGIIKQPGSSAVLWRQQREFLGRWAWNVKRCCMACSCSMAARLQPFENIQLLS